MSLLLARRGTLSGGGAAAGGGGGTETSGVSANSGQAYAERTAQYGYTFTPTGTLSVVRLRALVDSAVTLRARVWRNSDSAVLIDTTITTAAQVWSESDLFTAVDLASGVEHTVAIWGSGASYNRAAGGTVTYQSVVGFSSPYVYGQGGTNQRPTSTFTDPLGLADIVYLA